MVPRKSDVAYVCRISHPLPSSSNRDRDQTRWSPLGSDVPFHSRITIYYTSKHAKVPVRDLTDSQGLDHTLEPIMETGTYNWKSTCNQPFVFPRQGGSLVRPQRVAET